MEHKDRHGLLSNGPLQTSIEGVKMPNYLYKFPDISLRALIRNPEQEAAQAQDEDLEQRISAVTESLQLLEVGVAESGVMLSLAAHFDMMESEKSLTKMEMRRVKVNIS